MVDVSLGLDVSSSVVGWCVVPNSINDQLTIVPWLLHGNINLTKNKGGFWSKVDQMESELSSVIAMIGSAADACGDPLVVTRVFIEDPVERFRAGMSSAHTIAVLAKFNVLTSQHARRLLKIEPLYIGATTARKAIGVPLVSKKKSGIHHKLQVLEHLSNTVFSGTQWPKNKNGKIHEWVTDETDAFVIAVAGCLGEGTRA